MNITYSYISMAAYAAICSAILLYTLARARVSIKEGGLNREALGTGRYPWPLIAITVSVTMLGPADALGLSGRGYEYGLIWVLAPLGAAVAQIIAGLFFVNKIKAHPSQGQTLGDIVAQKFGNTVRPAVGLIVTLQAIAFSGVLVLAGAQILDVFLGVPKIYGFLLTALPIGIFTAIGGLSAIVRTDVFQSVLMVLALIFVVGTAFAILPATAPWEAPLPLKTERFDIEVGYAAIFTAFITYLFGEFLLPIYSQRALIAKSPADAKWGFVGAGIFVAIWYGVITFAGVVALAAVADVSDPEFVLLDNLKVLLGETGPAISIVSGIALVSLFALLHSTFDGILNAGGVSFSKDFAGSIIKLDDREQASVARRAMVAFAVLGMVIPFIWPDMIEMLLVGYTIWAPTVMPLLVYVLLSDQRPRKSFVFWVPFASGILGWAIAEYVLGHPYIPAILLGVVANICMIFVCSHIETRQIRAEAVTG